MRILFITGSGIGGSNRSLTMTVNALQKKGIECILVVPNEKTRSFFCNLCKIYVVGYEITIWPSLKSKTDYIFFLPKLIRFVLKNFFAKKKIMSICKKIHPQIIHENISVLNVGKKAALNCGAKYIRHVREYVKDDFDYNFFPTKKKFVSSLQKDFTITITKQLESYFGLVKNRVIYNGLISRDFSALIINKEPKRNYLFVGQITAGKGVDLMINVFLNFMKINRHQNLLIAGSGGKKYVDSLKAYVKKNGAENRIIFLGQRDDIPKLMSESIALIVPSVREAFGRITAEAMFYGCLVIGKNTGGTKEQFDNGLNVTKREIGLRFLNEKDLLDCLMMAESMDKNEMDEIIAAARQTVIELYSIETHSQKLIEYYQEILS